MDVMEEGRMAVFADPAGAVIGIWQPGRMKGAGLVNEEGTLGWNELVTSDVEGSKAFYAAVFGWDHASHEGGPPGGYTEWKAGGRTMGGMMAKPPGMPAEIPSYWGVYFVVSDVDATVDGLLRGLLRRPRPGPLRIPDHHRDRDGAGRAARRAARPRREAV